MICLLLPGNPYPVIENPNEPDNISGLPIRSGHQSHYVVSFDFYLFYKPYIIEVTGINGLPCKLDINQGVRLFNEIVIDQEAQVSSYTLITTNSLGGSYLPGSIR